MLGDDLCRLAGFRAGYFDAVQVKKMVEIPVGSKVAFFCVGPFDSVDVVGQTASGGNADGGFVVVVDVAQNHINDGDGFGAVAAVAEAGNAAGVFV